MSRVTLELTLDASVDMAYLSFVPPGKSGVRGTFECEDERLRGSVRIDVDSDGFILGIEVENASRVLPALLLSARQG
jgi:uncharacterized protein YuzE